MRLPSGRDRLRGSAASESALAEAVVFRRWRGASPVVVDRRRLGAIGGDGGFAMQGSLDLTALSRMR
jgi:hypothetical protein